MSEAFRGSVRNVARVRLTGVRCNTAVSRGPCLTLLERESVLWAGSAGCLAGLGSALAMLVVAAVAFRAQHCVAQTVDSTMWVSNGRVYAFAQSGTTIYVGGDFSYVGPRTGCAAVLDPNTGAPSASFPFVNAVVEAVASDSLGGWYVGGGFGTVGGVRRSHLVHILADGTLSAWNPSPDGDISAIAVSGRRVYVVGGFTSVDGVPRSHIAALDAGTGTALDWNPNATNGDPSTVVDVIVVRGNCVYVGGRFASIGGQARHNLAALDAVTGAALAWNPSPDDRVNALAVGGTTIYVGGWFSSIGAQTRTHIAAIDSTTGMAMSWAPNASDNVNALLVYGNAVYAGGYFRSIGGQVRDHLGAIDTGTGLATGWNPTANGEVWALALRDSTVYVGGAFGHVGGQFRNSIAALDARTGAATSWNPDGDATVGSIAATETSICVGGAFGSIGGRDRSSLAALDATTGRATDWDPSPNGVVWSIAAGGSTVYVGGGFTEIGGAARTALVAVDSSSGSVLAWNPDIRGAGALGVDALLIRGTALLVGGSFSEIGGQTRSNLAALDLASGLATPWRPDPDDAVLGLADDGATIYAGGWFANIGGQGRSCLAALDATTGAATAWNPDATYSGRPNVRALAVTDSVVYVGGVFTSIGGQPRSGLAALDRRTGLATAWNPAPDGFVRCLALYDSAVLVGGVFGEVGGREDWMLAAVDARTGLATTWNPAAYYPDLFNVDAILLSGSDVLAGGDTGNVPVLNFLGSSAFRLPGATIYPGDANNDGVVDARDILPIGLYFGLTGPARKDGSTNWGPQVLPIGWSAPNERAEYADCDGGGVVDAGDVLAVIQNWGARVGQPPPETDKRAVCEELLVALDQMPGTGGTNAIRNVVLDYLRKLPGQPAEFRVDPNRPNPFRGETAWVLTEPTPAPADLAIYDAGGRLVWRTSVSHPPVGASEIHWEGVDLLGRLVPAGSYYYRFTVGSYRANGRSTVIR